MEDCKCRRKNKSHQGANSMSKNTTSSKKKTICRRDRDYHAPISSPSLSVAFSTPVCSDIYVSAASSLVTYVPKVTSSAIKIAYLFVFILWRLNCVSVVRASLPDNGEQLKTSAGAASEIDLSLRAKEGGDIPVEHAQLKDNPHLKTASKTRISRFRPPRRPPRIIDPPALDAINYSELEYAYLYRSTEDKDGLESVKALHRQLDDDNDGSIEPSETGEFIRGDLKKDVKGADSGAIKFHRKDSEITVNDLWHTWWKSEVHNWTVDETVEWLSEPM